MKTILNSITSQVILLILIATTSYGQHTIIEHDSDVSLLSPQLLLLEDEPAGGDGWSRLWFKHADDPDNRWAFLARPGDGQTDQDNILTQPIIMAFNGVQKFGLDKNGRVRINKTYTLPTDIGIAGQMITTDGDSIGSWAFPRRIQDEDTDTKIRLNEGGSDNITIKVDAKETVEFTSDVTKMKERTQFTKDATFANPQVQIHNTTDDLGHLTFSNSGFVNNRFAISADPSGTAANPATMNLYWGSTSNPAAETNFISLDATNSVVELNQDTEINGIATMNEFMKLKPRVLPPTCAAGGTDNGKIYFSTTLKKVRVCVDGSWENLN